MFHSCAAFTVMRSFEPSQKSTPGIVFSLQNVPSNCSYEGRVHWALSPSSVQVPAIFQLMYFSQQRHPNQQSFGAFWRFFSQLKLLANMSIICSQPSLLNCSGLQITSSVVRRDNSPAILNKLESNYRTLNNGAQISGFIQHSLLLLS